MKNLFKIIFCSALTLNAAPTYAKLFVVTTTEDLAAITKEIGKEYVNVTSIAKGYQDPHMIEAKPSYLLNLRRADLLIQVGLELEIGWLPALLNSARNPKILPGSTGFLDTSSKITVQDTPQGKIDRSAGDIHPYGNPHYWLNPTNGLKMADQIAQKLKELDPEHATEYSKNHKVFESNLKDAIEKWLQLAAPLKGKSIITYHQSWSYFANFFDIEIANVIEPKPGIPPSPLHIQSLLNQIKRDKIPLIGIEPYVDHKLPQKIANDTKTVLVELSPSVGAKPDIKTYIELFDQNIQTLLIGLEKHHE